MAGWRAKLWQRGLARAAIMGREPTFNPSPAAASLLRLSVRKATLWSQGHARRRLTRNRTRTHNPLPAALVALSGLPGLSSLPVLGGLAKRFRQPSEKRAAALVPQLVQSANSGNLTAARAIHDRTTFGIAKERAVWLSALAQVSPPIMTEALRNPAVPAVDHSTPESAASSALANAFFHGGATGGGIGAVQLPAGQSVLQTAVGVAGAVRGSRATKGHGRAAAAPAMPPGDPSTWTKKQRARFGLTVAQVMRWNPDTERATKVYADSAEATSWPTVAQGRRQKKLASRLASAGGRVASAALPVAGGLALAGAKKLAASGAAVTLARSGVIIGGLAAGYYIGSALNKYLAGRALGKEQAGVQAALAFREARAQAAAQKGSPLTQTEVQSLGAVYKKQLVALGYDPVTFRRTRSIVERFFTGEEE